LDALNFISIANQNPMNFIYIKRAVRLKLTLDKVFQTTKCSPYLFKTYQCSFFEKNVLEHESVCYKRQFCNVCC